MRARSQPTIVNKNIITDVHIVIDLVEAYFPSLRVQVYGSTRSFSICMIRKNIKAVYKTEPSQACDSALRTSSISLTDFDDPLLISPAEEPVCLANPP